MEPVNLNNFIEKYERYKNIIEKLENGTWREDPEIAELSIEKIMNMRVIVDTAESLNINKVSRLPQNKQPN